MILTTSVFAYQPSLRDFFGFCQFIEILEDWHQEVFLTITKYDKPQQL